MASSGFTRIARNAGISAATVVMTSSMAQLITHASGSLTFTCTRKLESTFDKIHARNRPNGSPTIIARMPRQNASLRMSHVMCS